MKSEYGHDKINLSIMNDKAYHCAGCGSEVLPGQMHTCYRGEKLYRFLRRKYAKRAVEVKRQLARPAKKKYKVKTMK